jgi:hypothetical protein
VSHHLEHQAQTEVQYFQQLVFVKSLVLFAEEENYLFVVGYQQYQVGFETVVVLHLDVS